MKLPHCETHDVSSPEALIEKITADRTTHIELAVSESGLSESEWEGAYDAFEMLYQTRAKEITAVLGDPAWRGSWTSDDYPAWALGEEITVWDHPGGKVYLRIYNEDQEIPIVVALGTSDSTNGFNAEGESPYKANREYLKSQGEL
ncbi:MAG: hypothetical protein AAF514_12775 [Verrucomicrobiota bacterium]